MGVHSDILMKAKLYRRQGNLYLDVLRSHSGLPIPIYTGELIKPVSKENKNLLMSLRSCDS